MRLRHLGLLLGSATILVAATPAGRQKADDITHTHGFRNAKACTFQTAGENLFSGLGKLSYKRSLRIRRDIGGLNLGVEGKRSTRPDPSGGTDISETTVGTPLRPVRMHGLPLRSFAVGVEQRAESDGYYYRDVRLDASPGQARAMLRRMGVTAPANGYYAIKDDHPCGGALSVDGKAGATTIRCGWGC